MQYPQILENKIKRNLKLKLNYGKTASLVIELKNSFYENQN